MVLIWVGLAGWCGSTPSWGGSVLAGGCWVFAGTWGWFGAVFTDWVWPGLGWSFLGGISVLTAASSVFWVWPRWVGASASSWVGMVWSGAGWGGVRCAVSFSWQHGRWPGLVVGRWAAPLLAWWSASAMGTMWVSLCTMGLVGGTILYLRTASIIAEDCTGD